MAKKKPARAIFSFDGDNPRAQKVAARQAADLVTQASKETKAAIRLIVTQSISEGIPPYDAARLVKSIVGLNRPQAQAVKNYRRSLIEDGHSLERVNTLVDRYAEKKLSERATTIANTEILDSLNVGERESWKQARSQGFLSAEATKVWLVDVPCEQCQPLADVEVRLDEEFPFGGGDGPPLHPRCSCSQGIGRP